VVGQTIRKEVDMNKKTQNLYRYKDCGLDYIYLTNGYEVINDPEFGRAVSIHNLDGLNKAIAKGVIDHVPTFRGQEVRFFRSLLKLSQTEMGILLGCNLRTVQRWEEEKRNDAIPSTADRFLRLFYAAYADGKEAAHQVCEYLKEAQ
jgi:DNA-binding transcriptional regulator YiaG